MVERRRGEKAVDGRNRPAGLSEQPTPAVRHFLRDRKEPISKPRRQFLLQPHSQAFFAASPRKYFDSLSDLAQRQHTEMECVIRNVLEPFDQLARGLAPS